jgi:hypothetical protein
MAIRADRTTYELAPRYENKRNGKPLSGFALDLTIRFNHEGAAFLQDHNLAGVMPFNELSELLELVEGEVTRLYASHFDTA